MTPFDFTRADTPDHAIQVTLAAGAGLKKGIPYPTRFLAGGTNLIDLMKDDVERPALVVDINRLALSAIEELPDGGVRLGALATNADTARHPLVVERYPLLASAILAGASPQLRNAATNGGNINQRTRCYYFYDTATPCNKREPGSGCSAIGGVTRIHAILGTSENCIATHPSDMCVALAALDAQVHVTGPDGTRVIPFAEYHRLPADEPWSDNTLREAELVTGIDLPVADFGIHYSYLKLRDRLSYAFALVSVAVAMRVDANGVISDARVALGGVAHKPWRVPEAEQLMEQASASRELFSQVADSVLRSALSQGGNGFKIELARRAIVRALTQAAEGRPQSQSDKRIA